MTPRMILALSLAFALQAPKPVSTTPTTCLKEVRDYAAARRAEVPAAVPVSQAAPNAQATAQNQARAQLLNQITVDKTALAKACAAQFDVKTVADAEVTNLSLLYTEAAQPDLAKAAIERAVTLKTQTQADRATTLSTAISQFLREPKGPERDARLEALVDELDTLPNEFLSRKFSAHSTLESYYYGLDLDAGIIKHSTWLMEAVKASDAEARKTWAPRVVSAYVALAERWAGQGFTDKAIELLIRAPVELQDVPNIESTIAPTLARYRLVGAPAAPIVGAAWLNMPAGTSELPMVGTVTLLEFSAHWCAPCLKTYPTISRLLQQYGSQGFRVVFATQLYGYFGADKDLAADAEIARDRAYFAEHQLNVPVAIADKGVARPGARVKRGQNEERYQVLAIPQLQVIDKHGTIRLIMVGYDEANEQKLSQLIATLLKEK